jgi:hypothetical protein
MNPFNLNEVETTQAIQNLSAAPEGPLTWEEFESLCGINFPRPEKGSIEWDGYVQKRNQLRKRLNGEAMELGKTKAFQVRPPSPGNPHELEKMSGTRLFENWLGQQKTRVTNAPRNFVSVMNGMVENFSLPQKTRNKAINYATVGNMLSGVTKKMIEDVLEDKEMELPDYSRDELLRLTIQSADKSLSDDDEAA